MHESFWSFAARQLLTMLLTIWLAMTLVFVALRILPGDAITAQFAQTGASSEIIAARRAAFYLDKSVPQQYLLYLRDLLRGDLGQSLYGGQTVTEILRQRLPTTLELAGLSIVVASIFGVMLGMMSGLASGWLARFAQGTVDLSIGMPIYWTGTLVLFLLAGYAGGQSGIILPVAVLSFHTAGAIARLTHTHVQQAKQHPMVRAAHSRGLSPNYVRWQYILRPGLIPVITVIALQAGILFSGTVITESIFLRPGIGLLLWDATLQRNYPVVQGVVLVIATVYISANTLADLLAYMLDPRMRYTP